MNEFGEIIEIKDKNAVVKVKRSSACGDCCACAKGTNPDDMILTVSNELNGEVGDQVELELASGQVLKASAVAYVIPLFALILGIAAGYILGGRLGFNQELGASLLGLLFTMLSFFLIRVMEPQFRKGHKFSPQVTQIIKRDRKGENEDGK
jgi:sigma-E factor negative regulatory protein RseC